MRNNINQQPIDFPHEVWYISDAIEIIHHSEIKRLLDCPFFFAKLPEWLDEGERAFRFKGDSANRIANRIAN